MGGENKVFAMPKCYSFLDLLCQQDNYTIFFVFLLFDRQKNPEYGER